MTDADSIWESKLGRLQDPNLEKMKPFVERMGELMQRRQEKGEPRPDAPGAQEGARRPWWRRMFGTRRLKGGQVTDEFVVTDEDVERFLRVVSDLGKDDPKGRARGQAVMQCMGW